MITICHDIYISLEIIIIKYNCKNNMDTLKPIYNNIKNLEPKLPEIIKCSCCKEDFKSFLKLDAIPSRDALRGGIKKIR